MKVFKRTLSVCVALVLALSAIAAPITASATTPEPISGLTAAQSSNVSAETLHPFTSTEALIRDAIEELRAMDITQTEKEPDKALVNAVEKSAEMTYDAVKDTIATDLKDELSDGAIDVSKYGLSKENMSKLMDEILNENYLYNAVEDLRFTTVNNKVTKISFDVTEGYAAAMEALEQELSELDVEIAVDPTSEVALEQDGDSISGHSLLLNADPNAACTRHTVSAQVIGDFNEDENINVGDVVTLRNQIVNEEVEDIADINGDGEINVADVIALRNAVVNEVELTTGSGIVNYTWAEVKDPTPKFRTNENGQFLDSEGNVTEDYTKAITNGGLIYNPEDGTISEGILADVYYKLTEISFRCSACGHDIVIMDNPETEEDELADLSMTQDIWINLNTFESIACNPGETPTPAEGETLEDDYLLYTDMQIGFYVDDTYGPLIGPDGKPVLDQNGDWIPAYVMDEQGNPILDANGNVQVIGMYNSAPQDNGAAEVAYYYSILSAFNADKAEYFGVSTDYWTSKNTEANPMAALKVLCNLDPNQDIPPAQMIQMVQMLPQAFMAYVHYYGAELLAMRDAAVAAVKKLPSNATDIHKMLVLHDWLAENATFDMGSMLNVTGTGGNNDPIQMTTFGALLSYQLTEMQQANYYGGVCLAYAAAYTYLVQAAFPEIYTENGKWCTPAQVDAKGGDIVDFNQVMFYADTAETSIAGEGFGGGAFNNVHYFNAVKIKNAPTSNNADDKMIGNWFYADVCYDDIYVECISQYRVEGDGAVNHSYFLVSPQTMGKMWADSIDYIDSLYDGYTYVVETDGQGNPVPSDNIDSSAEYYDPTHPNYVKADASNETKNDNTCYEDTWFSGAVSKIYNDGTNWYYVDSGSNSSTYSSMINDDGSIDIDMDQMGENGLNMSQMMHANRVDIEKQDKMKSRPMNAPDYWNDEDDNQQNNGYGSLDMETKTDPHATVLFDYGTGSINGNTANDAMKAAIEEDFIYNEQYPGLNHSIALIDGKIYFNLGNQIWTLSKSNGWGGGSWSVSNSAFREYNAVSASSDGRAFKGSSYFFDEKGTALSAKNPPIAAMVSHDKYKPLYNYVDAEGQIVLDFQGNPSDAYMAKLQSGQMTQEQMEAAIVGRVFAMMYAEPTMTVSLATNRSYTAAFNDSMSDDQKRASIYTKDAVNYNPDYTQGISEDSENDNGEFLWCANIVEATAQADWASKTIGTDTVPCSAKLDGHSYQYNSTEDAYLCNTCGLHAYNLVNQPTNGKITLTAITDSGISQDFIDQNQQQGGDQLSTTTTPVSPDREGATTQKEVVVTVTPKDNTFGLPTVTYIIEDGNGSGVEVPMTRNEDGTYTGTITKESECCLIISAELRNTVNVTVNEAEHGEVTVLTTVKVPSAQQGENGAGVIQVKEGETGDAPNNDKLTIVATPDEGYVVKSVKVNDEVITATEGAYTYPLNNKAVTVVVEFAELFDVKVEEAENGTVEADPAVAKEGETVTLTVDPADEYDVGSVMYTYTELVDEVLTSKEVAINPTGDVYSFEMPAADVTVKATFVAKSYNITVDEDIEGGMVEAPTSAKVNDFVTLTITPDEGKELESLAIEYGEETVTVTGNKFTMPAADVTVTATFRDKEYNVKVSELITGASVDAPETAKKGESVTVSVTPPTGFDIEDVTVAGVVVTETSDGKYAFTMPANDVVVTVTFVEIESEGGNGSTEGGNGSTEGGNGSTEGGNGSTEGGNGSTEGGNGSTDGGNGSTEGGNGSTEGGNGSNEGGENT